MVFYQKQRRSILIFTGLMVLLIMIGFSYGYILRLAEMRPPREVTEDNQGDLQAVEDFEVIQSQQASTAGKDSVLVLERFYARCQHILTDEMVIDTTHVGATGDDLDQAFPTWELVSFTPERVMFTVDIDGYCPRHFIIMEDNGYLVIYRSEVETGNLYPVEQTNIQLDWLSPEMQEQIRVGLVVDSIEEIEHLIENWES